jgi:acetyl esterase
MRAERAVTKALFALPPRIQVRLSGQPPVSIDGLTLAPEVQLALSLLERRGEPPISEIGPEAARARRRHGAAIYGGAPLPVAAVRDLSIPADGGELPLRHYVPPGGTTGEPLLVYFHGGGFVFGDLDTHDALCRLLCVHADTQVLAVHYRLAPEHPFPAAMQDGFAALSWAYENADSLGANPLRVAVGGDSAGGNLAAVVCQLCARTQRPQPAMQLLIYPATDMSRQHRSRALFAKGFFLTGAEMDWFEAQYVGGQPGIATDPRVSPLLAEDLSGLAPALVATAGFDPLRDEGEEYARALQRAGTPAVLRRFPGLIHGFASAAGVSRASRDALLELAGATRALLATAPPAPTRRGPAAAEAPVASG